MPALKPAKIYMPTSDSKSRPGRGEKRVHISYGNWSISKAITIDSEGEGGEPLQVQIKTSGEGGDHVGVILRKFLNRRTET